jgi:hypothetical protein
MQLHHCKKKRFLKKVSARTAYPAHYLSPRSGFLNKFRPVPPTPPTTYPLDFNWSRAHQRESRIDKETSGHFFDFLQPPQPPWDLGARVVGPRDAVGPGRHATSGPGANPTNPNNSGLPTCQEPTCHFTSKSE